LGVGGWGFGQEKERKGGERAGLMVKEGKGMQSAGCVMVGRGKNVDEGISADGESLVQNFLALGPITLILMICFIAYWLQLSQKKRAEITEMVVVQED